jgi:hypothetical protein
MEPPRAARPAAFRRLGLVALNIAYRALAGLLIASPFVALLNSAVAHHPRGDATLFDPGATMLFEALRLARPGAAGAVFASAPIALLAMFLGLVPFAALIAGLGRKGRLGAGYLAARALRPIGTLSLLWGFGVVAQAIVAVLTVLLGGKLIHVLHLSTVAEDIGRLVLAGVTLLGVLAVGVVRDIAAVAAVNDGSRLYTSVARALRVTFGAFGSVAFAYASRGILAVAAVAAAVYLVSARSRGDQPSFEIPFAIHQGAIAVTVFMHASWLAAAIRLLDRVAPLPELRTPAPARPPEPSIAPETLSSAALQERPSEPSAALEEPSLEEVSPEEPALKKPSPEKPSPEKPSPEKPSLEAVSLEEVSLDKLSPQKPSPQKPSPQKAGLVERWLEEPSPKTRSSKED